jgi:integrase/recombinase XerD
MKMIKALDGYFLTRALDLSPNTQEMYKWALDRICKYLKNPEVEDITEKELLNFYVFLRDDYVPNRANRKTEPLTPRSVENIWTAMRSFFNWAEIELHLVTRPDKRIRRPKYKKAMIQPFTEEDIVKLLKACEYTSTARTEKRKAFTMRRKTATRDSAIVWVLLDTALR